MRTIGTSVLGADFAGPHLLKNGRRWWTVCSTALRRREYCSFLARRIAWLRLCEANVPPERLKIRVGNDFHDAAIA